MNPLWMGILNISPDSFSDGGKYNSNEKIIEKCLDFVKNGAQIIDFGAVASNPKIENIKVSSEDELKLLLSPLKQVRQILPKNILISVDTFSPYVAYKLAQENLIDIINDIFASQKIELIDNLEWTTAHIAAKFNLQLVLMHMPRQKEENSSVNNILTFLEERIKFCHKIGVHKIIIDPGIGYGRFGKTFQEILEILKPESLWKLKQLNVPLLIGVSRKSFQQDMDAALISPISRDKLTKEIELHCINCGANIIRSHCVGIE